MGHISFFCQASACAHVFTGDVLFVGGCGKFFEGTAQEMYPSLYEKLGVLPVETQVTQRRLRGNRFLVCLSRHGAPAVCRFGQGMSTR